MTVSADNTIAFRGVSIDTLDKLNNAISSAELLFMAAAGLSQDDRDPISHGVYHTITLLNEIRDELDAARSEPT
jgi:hypothetical protein